MLTEVWNYLCEFNTVSVVLRLLLSTVCAGIIGLERGRHGRSAGLRTHILVCLGATMAALVGQYCMYAISIPAGMSGDPARIAAQVISGIGFLGAGTIMLKQDHHISGLTTAAGVWNVAGIGLAFGFGFYVGAVICTVISVVSITLLRRIENNVYHKPKTVLYAELELVSDVNRVSAAVLNMPTVHDVDVVPARSGIEKHVGLSVILKEVGEDAAEETLLAVRETDGVVYALNRS